MDREADSTNEKQDKRVEHKRSCRFLNNDTKPETFVLDISKQAACNSTIPAKTKKSGANAGSIRVNTAKISKAPNAGSGAGHKGKVLPAIDDASRFSNRGLLDENDLNTRYYKIE